ncbi:MAG TPA: hypothetical protein PLT82_06575 [Candidatus Hydrogenedens sp.]|nr:hypothetical protein [Candidatus Hydrogenedens sp.]HOK09073.1 hypothetical protein [Candidatus Hydrogenedens sp.]HOL19139.1 hypothetical protein [Candidatus Hydrogenedens sp.]HPP58781.1 hypothetical protein [Candidatus Hydrogenedens sp.]
MKKASLKQSRMVYVAMVIALTILLTGCPTKKDDAEYEQGFYDGFMQDDYYWTGFYDSYDTVDGGPIYYRGDQIPSVTSPSYDRGYYDGLWYAYNDGYFVEYDYAFTIGFSEGYDCAYQAGWATFLAVDSHIEWQDGGFSDGYNDGFSEGRVFGAYDYINGIPYDWLGAMMDYRQGLDLSVDGVSTGNQGPVILYEWGTDPKTLQKSKASNNGVPGRSIRYTHSEHDTKEFSPPEISYRTMPEDAMNKYNVVPTTSPRNSSQNLTLTTSWLERINQYRNVMGK